MTAAENAATLESVIDHIHSDAELSGVRYRVGRKALKRNEDYPRVVWMPAGGDIESPDRGGAVASNGQRLRSLATDAAGFSVACWAKDIECAKALMHAVIAASRRSCGNSVRFGAYEWPTQDDTADHARRGEVIVLAVVLRVPVLANDPTRVRLLTTLTAQDHTTEFVSDLDGSPEVVC